MAKVHGKDTFVSLDGDNLSTYSNSVEFVRTGDSHDVTTFGNSDHVYLGGLGDGTTTLGGFYDSTASTGPRAVIEPLIGTVVTMIYQSEGTGSSKPQDSVSVLVTSYTETNPVADYKTWEVELQHSGAVNSAAQGA